MNTILYATDRTEEAVPVLRYALDLSVRLGAKLIVLYVHHISPVRTVVSRPFAQLERHVIAEQRGVLEAYCAKHLGNGINGNRIQFEVKCVDSVLNGIVDKAKELSPDFVLIGRKEKHTDRGLLAGDIGKGLVKRLSCPALIAPTDVSNTPIKTILYATDFEEADIAAIKNLVTIAKTVNAKIHIVHIATEKQYAGKEQMEWFKEMLQQHIDYENLEFKVITSEHIVKKLDIYSQLIQADLVALLHREKGFFRNLFSKSLVSKLEAHIGIPLLSFNKAI